MRYRSFKFADYIFLLDPRDSIPFTIFRNRRIKYRCVLLEGKRRCRGGGSCDSNGDSGLQFTPPRATARGVSKGSYGTGLVFRGRWNFEGKSAE